MSSRILIGDVRERLAELPAGSVQCVVTSPPYFGLRDYGTAGQIGLEPTLAGYLAAMVEVFRGVRRVLRDDGVVWLNIGDSYAGGKMGRDDDGPDDLARRAALYSTGVRKAGAKGKNGVQRKPPAGMKSKDLMMVPARLAIALQDDGWYLRSDIIWAKPNPMPESVTDRPTSAHEHIFLLTKSARYYYDSAAVAEESVSDHPSGNGYKRDARLSYDGRGNDEQWQVSATRNLRNVWEIATQPFSGAHFATFPLEIPRRCIKAGTSEKGACSACGSPWRRVVERTPFPRDKTAHRGRSAWADGSQRNDGDITRSGQEFNRWTVEHPPTTTGWEPTCSCNADVIPCTVLDPFLGSGTTLLVADQLGRNGIGIELNPAYAAMAKQRITGDAPMFASVELCAGVAGPGKK